MSLETGTYISDLNSANPVGASDPLSDVDGHIQLLKSTIQATFPNINGVVSGTPAELNFLASVTAGTAAASKAVVLDASKNIATINQVTATTFVGALTGNVTGNITGNVTGNVTGNLTGTASAVAADSIGQAAIDVTSLSPIIQTIKTANTSYTSHTTATPGDNTIPQVTEGEQILSRAITPNHASNILRIKVLVHCSNNGTQMTAHLHQDGGANAIAMGVVDYASGVIGQLHFEYEMAAGTTSATTFTVRLGSETGTTYVNGDSGGRLGGGILQSYIVIDEIQQA